MLVKVRRVHYFDRAYHLSHHEMLVNTRYIIRANVIITNAEGVDPCVELHVEKEGILIVQGFIQDFLPPNNL